MKLSIDLKGPDGNVYSLVAKCCDALKKQGKNDDAVRLKKQAFEQRSYEAVLELCKKYVNVTFER